MSAGQGLAKGVGLVKSVKKDANEVKIVVEKKYTSGDKLVENKHTKNIKQEKDSSYLLNEDSVLLSVRPSVRPSV